MWITHKYVILTWLSKKIFYKESSLLLQKHSTTFSWHPDFVSHVLQMNQRGILAGAPSLHIYKDEANNEREFYLEGKMYHKGCPARHSDPLSNLKNINSTSLSKNSITNYYAVDTLLEEGNPSVCTVVSITLFSLMDDIYEMPQTQEPPCHDSPSARKLQIPWETFSEKLAENTADRKRFHHSFALHCFFFWREREKKASEV